MSFSVIHPITGKKHSNLEKLENSFLCVFMDQKDIETGDPYPEVIRDALRDSMELCLLFSEQCKDSEWINTEWGAAWALRKRIVPILLDTGESKLPARLQTRQAIPFRKADKYVSDVLKRRYILDFGDE